MTRPTQGVCVMAMRGLSRRGLGEPEARGWGCVPAHPWDRVPAPCRDWPCSALTPPPTSGSHPSCLAGLSGGLGLSPRVALLACISPLLLEWASVALCPLLSGHVCSQPTDRTAVPGPQEGGSPGSQRWPGLCSPPPSGVWSPAHGLPAPVCRHQGPRHHMCQSPFAASPAEVSQHPWRHPAPPPACPGALPGLLRPGRQPACVSRSPSSF